MLSSSHSGRKLIVVLWVMGKRELQPWCRSEGESAYTVEEKRGDESPPSSIGHYLAKNGGMMMRRVLRMVFGDRLLAQERKQCFRGEKQQLAISRASFWFHLGVRDHERNFKFVSWHYLDQ
jgi:hypothetical protein